MNRSIGLRSSAFLVIGLVFSTINVQAQTDVSHYNVIWDSPSQNSSGSMPLGNGDIGLNAWVEKNGDLLFYISKTDAWSGNGRLLKLGRVRVRLNPNPLKKNDSFRQTLSLKDATIRIEAGQGNDSIELLLWADANAPIVHIQANGQKPFEIETKLESWRNEIREMTSEREKFSAYGISSAPFPIRVMPDRTIETKDNRIVWYHRNESSIWGPTLELQGLQTFRAHAQDPLLHRTFGGAIEGDGFIKRDNTTLISKQPNQEFAITIHLLTAQTDTAEDWLAQLDDSIHNNKQPLPESRKQHEVWWEQFWNRSWIHITSEKEPDIAFRVSQGYALQRFITACAGRGAFPIKFNGSIFTVDALEKDEKFDADYRRWGGPYWFQNTRLPYWPMLNCGDFEMMQPLFAMYLAGLPLAKERTQIYFGHEGAFFPETMYFWGAYANDNYGWDREGKHPSYVDNRYIRWYWSNNLELLALMLDYYDFSGDDRFLTYDFLPFSDEVLTFFDKHYKRDEQGKLHFEPAQALETWHDAVNPTPEIAGLRWVLERLNRLPDIYRNNTRRALWKHLRDDLPGLPKATENGQTYILPAEKFENLSNSENPELYAIFPYRLFGIGKPNVDIARLTFEKRRVKRTGGWTQDPIQAALLGLNDIAKEYTTQNFKTHDPGSRFPAFWGPNFDWVPDQDHGGVSMIALQKMLMQTDDGSIRLFPAWPKTWDVEFKLHAPDNTTVEGVCQAGQLTGLKVTPDKKRLTIINTFNP